MSDSPDFDPAEERGPIAWMAKNAVASNVLMLVLIVGGLVTLASGIRQEVFPEVEMDIVSIEISYPGASPAEVEQAVILAVEEAIRGIDGVKKVSSTAMEGIGMISVELLLGTDKDRALNDAKSAIDRITSFPQDVERPTVSLISNRQQVISLVLYGDVDEATLRAVAENSRRELLRDERVTYVELTGIRPLEISIEVPQAQLRKYGLTLDEIAARIRAASVELPGGGVKTDAGEVLLRTTERRDRGDEFGDIILLSQPDGSQVRVRDVATVRDGFQENDKEATYNGKRAAMINIFRVGDETPLTVAAAGKEYVQKLKDTLPQGLSAAPWFDTSEMYEQRISLLMNNARIGLLLVLLTLGLFLEARLAFWVTLGIPISFAGSLLFFPVTDISINMISLFAFIITLGMVVDDAIVVGESIHKHRSDGKGRLEAAITGAKEVAQPVIFAILTSCVAFAPMLVVPGPMGKFFRVVPIVVIAVLMISLVESLLILPAHLSHPMPWGVRVILSPYLFVMRFVAKLEMPHRLQRFVQHVYVPLLKKALEWRYFTITLGIATLLFTLGYVAGRIPFTFLPKVEGDMITAHLKMPVGTPVAETERIAHRIGATAQAIIDQEDAESDSSTMSRGLYEEVGAMSLIEASIDVLGREGSHLATVMVYLTDAGSRELTTQQFVQRWRDDIGEIPGAESLVFSYEVGVEPGSPIDIQLIHDDVPTLEAAAERLASEISSYSGLRDIDSGVTRGKEQLDFRLTDAAVAQGLTELELARQVRAAFFGAEAVRQQRGRDEVRAYVRLPLDERQSLYNVEELVIRTPSGGEMPLAQAAILERGQAYTAINRTDGRRNISVTADIADEEANANEIVGQIRQRELPQLLADFPGLAYSLGGEQERQAETMSALGLGFVLALIVMFSMLAVVFRSYTQPLLVMLAIPFGMVGAVWGHVVMGFTLSLMSMMGLVALSGVVVNDSLILIVSINRYREEGMSMWDAIIAGGARRFRPILLTSLTTFFGLAPMILETSVQARFLIPMAVSLGFGVLAATFILLLIVPCSYVAMEDARRNMGNFFARLRGRPTVPPPPPSEPADAEIELLVAEE
ncbi:MAG: efflux RND transporter permease subunit [Myxococcales bacterium]|nr:efflux RND transporter permease subunit [Myxococcales bacterium]MDH3484293.1 efflux RND transporter permease subunit [Myxococcales bacterium]